MRTPQKPIIFRSNLLKWFYKNPRPLPWKSTKDPYKIWVSEIILQQTRVKQGISYYKRFIEEFPTIQSLASAPVDKVLKIWEGLGYYSRARNMHTAANTIVKKYDGMIPEDYNMLLSLRGVGKYTAAAISSFAFDQAHPVVDGNVIRVITRIFGITDDIHKSDTKKTIENLALQCLDTTEPARHNQAIMDFGAIQCKPINPKCSQCIMNTCCSAYSKSIVDQIPARKQSNIRKNRHFQYLVIHNADHILLKQRRSKDIWNLLYDFPLIEIDEINEKELSMQIKLLFKNQINLEDINESKLYKQQLSHQNIHAIFHDVQVQASEKKLMPKRDYILVNYKNLSNFAFPKIIDCYLKDKSIYLN